VTASTQGRSADTSGIARTSNPRPAVGSSGPVRSACPLCAHARGVPVCDRDGKTGRALDVVACAECGFVRQDPLPPAEDLAAWYRGHYRTAYKGVATPRLRHVWRAAGLALERLSFVSPYLRPGSRTLDVGAGGGEFVALLARRGHDAHGLEPDEGYAGFARAAYGVDVRTGALDDLPDEAPWDLITLFHVLEHLPDPVRPLERLRRRLAPGGTLVVEVPNVEFLRCAPSNLFFAAHVHYFSGRTLARAAALAGLEPVSSRPSPSGANLRIALRAADGPPRRAAPADPAALRRALRAQAARTWGRYLHPARALPRLAARWRQWREESTLARRIGDATALLDHRFGPAPRPLPPPTPGPSAPRSGSDRPRRADPAAASAARDGTRPSSG
jgi:2-polyprenyl-3-methyl-5-hydroxy-6-metoxy-1,4-benzoquinol methylase